MPSAFFERKISTPSQNNDIKEINTQQESFVDNRASSNEISQLQSNVNSSINSQEITQLQEKVDNTTGMPDDLKKGVENLSEQDMSDVKVHYNSDKPAQLQAHAYARGTDIHIAPGQEKHLPHEAWHVVQQKQGRVQPTMQMKGNVNVNDDAGLEKEADVMGQKALQLKSNNQENLNHSQLEFNAVYQFKVDAIHGATCPTLADTEGTDDYLSFVSNMNALGKTMGVPIDKTVTNEIWVKAMQILWKTQDMTGMGTLQDKQAGTTKDKTASKPKDAREETPTDQGARFNFDFASDTFQEVLQNDFKTLAGLIMDNFKQTFESKRIFGFWSKDPAMEVGKSSKALMLEDSALGKPFDGINLTGNWNMELWGAISHYYAEAVSKNIGQSNIQYWGFVGDGATGDVDNIYAKVEKVKFQAMGKEKNITAEAMESIILWHGCLSDINDQGEKIKATPHPGYNVMGLIGVLNVGSDRHKIASEVEDKTKLLKEVKSTRVSRN